MKTSMKLTELNDGQAVFIDANIFIYHFAGSSIECREFLKQCAGKRLNGFTSNSILAETCHRLMAMEAVKLKIAKPLKPSASLQENPALVKQLSEYYTQITNILSWNIQIISSPKNLFIHSQIYRQRFGLLTNDSLIPVYMEAAGIDNLVSADKIFQTIPHLNLYSPSDLTI